MIITLPEPIKCLRCGHSWQPRKAEVRFCPKCKSPYFNKPRRTPRQASGSVKASG